MASGRVSVMNELSIARDKHVREHGKPPTGWDHFPAIISVRHFDMRHESYRFICLHGNSQVDAETNDGAEQTAAFNELLGKHNAEYGCDCRPGEWWERWDRLDDAVDQHQFDVANPPTEPYLLEHMPKVVRRLERLLTLGCAECRPSLVSFWDIVAGTDEETMRLVHSGGCSRFTPAILELDGTRGAIAHTY